jgi:hypothetical protein
VITAYSQEKLFHPAVKGWAKRLHDERPVQAPGIVFPANPAAAFAPMVNEKGEPLGVRVFTEDQKAGRTLSKANENRIRSTLADIQEARKIDDLPRAADALLGNGEGKLEEVLETLGEEGDDDGKTTDPPEPKHAPTENEVVAFVAGATPETVKRLVALLRTRLTYDEKTAFNEYVERLLS